MGDIKRFLSHIGYTEQFELQGQSPLDEARVLELLLASYDRVWQGLSEDPHLATDRVKHATYFRWFDTGAWLTRPAYLFLDYPAPVTCEFLRFRLGGHRLQVEVGRWENPRPRHLRLCQRCSMRRVDDERHLVFECPAFDEFRYARRQLFAGVAGEDMRAFLSQQDQGAVLWFVVDCLRWEGPCESVQEQDCDALGDLEVQLGRQASQADTYD